LERPRSRRADPRVAPAGRADDRTLGPRQRPDVMLRTGAAGAVPRAADRRVPARAHAAAAAPRAAAAARARTDPARPRVLRAHRSDGARAADDDRRPRSPARADARSEHLQRTAVLAAGTSHRRA